MEQALRNLNEKIKTITKPNPQIYSNALTRQLMWSRNVTIFYVYSSFIIFNSIHTAISDLSLPLKLISALFSIGLLLPFVILCRSYFWAFNIISMFIFIIYGYKCFDIIPEAPYAFTGYIFLNTITILVSSRDVRLTLGAAGIYIWICLTKFREELLKKIREDDPEIFVNQYLKLTILIFILMVLASIALVTTLDKRSIELLRVKSALENALEQQKTFIFSFSHELRNPINSLLGNLQLVLQGETLSAKAAEMLDVAKVCGEILLHNINNVLDIGKHEIGKLEINPVSTQLKELFQRTWSIYGELLRQKKLRGQLKIDKDLPAMVRIDSHKLNQILLNLIGNSIKFTEKGSVTVIVRWLKEQDVNEKCFEPIPYDDADEGLFEKEENLSMIETSRFSERQGLSHRGRQQESHKMLHSHQESRGVLKIIVKDTGCGMKKEAVEKLFRKFSQVSENASQRQIGTGLGLFITKEICLAMNGEIRAYSKPGTGSTFVICIPSTTISAENIERASPEAIINQLTRKHLKALVADDSPFNVNLICNYFSQFEGSVKSVAYNGYDIFLKYREYRQSNTEIDVVTLDIDMPIMGGREVCDNIRRYERENRLRPVLIILISGNYDKEQVEEYVNPENEHKADCFLRKPISFSEFNRAVYDLVFVSHQRL